MKSLLKIGVILVLTGVWLGCEGDYRQRARGGFGEVIVVMDSTQHESETADAIRETFGELIRTVPNPQPKFDLMFRDITSNQQLEDLKRFKNIIFAAPIDDSTNTGRFIRALLSDEVEQQVRNEEAFAFPLEDRWYRDQWALLLSGPSDSALAQQVRNSKETLTTNLLDKEFNRWREDIYDRGEQVALSDSLWNENGWKIRVQHDWNKMIDTTYTDGNGQTNRFMTMRRPLPDNDRWFWAWWINDVENINFVDNDWINAKRDSLMEQWIRGTRDSSYVTTEYRRPVNTSSFTHNGDMVYETLGTWQMTHDAMGGPFVNFTVYDEETQRLFMLEFGQFAPKYNKRRFVRQFRTILRTFESDSTWQEVNQEDISAGE